MHSRCFVLRHLVVALLLAWGISACTPKSVPVAPTEPSVPTDVVVPPMPEILPEVTFGDTPQMPSLAAPLSDEPLLSMADQASQHSRMIKHFFGPWSQTRASVPARDAFGTAHLYGGKAGWAENLQPYPAERWTKLVALQNMGGYPSMAVPAVTTRNTALRAMPTQRPFFLDPSKPGEGFPFDYFQISELWLGSPVLITHASTDKAWSFVETPLACGWVRSEDIAVVSQAFRGEYETGQYVALRQDDVPLVATDGRFVGQSHLGALFPLQGQTPSGYRIKVPVRNASGQAETTVVEVSMLQAGQTPFPLTSRNVAMLADTMYGQPYGWGGLYENRDCSSTVRDLFLPFGIWLPRNSAQQAQQGGVLINLEKQGVESKLAIIRDRGIPYYSLIWLKGHIGLYLGLNSRGEPLMMHNIWGVRTMLPGGGEGRAIVGRLVVSTLRPGEDRPDVRRGLFLDRVIGLTTLPSRGSK